MDSIATYISKDSVRYAERLVQQIFERTELLMTNPKSGRMVPEFRKKNLRELILGNYRIVYITYPRHVDIIRIHHSKRRISKRSLFES